jgi:hypothetical protein
MAPKATKQPMTTANVPAKVTANLPVATSAQCVTPKSAIAGNADTPTTVLSRYERLQLAAKRFENRKVKKRSASMLTPTVSKKPEKQDAVEPTKKQPAAAIETTPKLLTERFFCDPCDKQFRTLPCLWLHTLFR